MDRFIPEGCTLIADNGTGGEVYADYDLLVAIAYGGKRRKHDWYYRFGSIELLKERAARHLGNLAAQKARKATRRAERATAARELQIGDVLLNSWGYDQTNTDYFQVVGLIGKMSVKIRPISSDYTATGDMTSWTTPAPGFFTGEAMTKRVLWGTSVKIHSWGSYARRINPAESFSCSSYA